MVKLPSEPIRYDALTGISFVAAFGVFLAHFCDFGFGSQGVSLFFVLSGFILTKTYVDRTWTFSQFYWARFARIYPVYVFSLLFALPKSWDLIHTHDYPVWFMVSVLGLLHAWFPSTAHLWNNPSWSLSAEALFYLVFPLVIPYSNIRVRYLVVAILALWSLHSLIRILVHYPDGGQFMSQFPLMRLPEFLIGIAFGRLQGRVTIPNALPVSATLILFAALFMPSLGAHTTLAPVYGLLFMGLANHHGILTTKPMMLLGEASYSFYLFQMPMYFILLEVSMPPFVKIPLLFVLTLGLSLFSFFVVERPSRTWLLSRLGPILSPSNQKAKEEPLINR